MATIPKSTNNVAGNEEVDIQRRLAPLFSELIHRVANSMMDGHHQLYHGATALKGQGRPNAMDCRTLLYANQVYLKQCESSDSLTGGNGEPESSTGGTLKHNVKAIEVASLVKLHEDYQAFIHQRWLLSGSVAGDWVQRTDQVVRRLLGKAEQHVTSVCKTYLVHTLRKGKIQLRFTNTPPTRSKITGGEQKSFGNSEGRASSSSSLQFVSETCVVSPPFVIQLWGDRKDLASRYCLPSRVVAEMCATPCGPPIHAPFRCAFRWGTTFVTASMVLPLLHIPLKLLQTPVDSDAEQDSKNITPRGEEGGGRKTNPTSVSVNSLEGAPELCCYYGREAMMSLLRVHGCPNDEIHFPERRSSDGKLIAVTSRGGVPVESDDGRVLELTSHDTMCRVGTDGRFYFLCLDAMLYTLKWRPNHIDERQNLTETMMYSIRALAARLDKEVRTSKNAGPSMNQLDFASEVQKFGIPIRRLGIVYNECVSDQARCLCMTEMCGRVLHDLLWYYTVKAPGIDEVGELVSVSPAASRKGGKNEGGEEEGVQLFSLSSFVDGQANSTGTKPTASKAPSYVEGYSVNHAKHVLHMARCLLSLLTHPSTSLAFIQDCLIPLASVRFQMDGFQELTSDRSVEEGGGRRFVVPIAMAQVIPIAGVREVFLQKMGMLDVVLRYQEGYRDDFETEDGGAVNEDGISENSENEAEGNEEEDEDEDHEAVFSHLVARILSSIRHLHPVLRDASAYEVEGPSILHHLPSKFAHMVDPITLSRDVQKQYDLQQHQDNDGRRGGNQNPLLLSSSSAALGMQPTFASYGGLGEEGQENAGLLAGSANLNKSKTNMNLEEQHRMKYEEISPIRSWLMAILRDADYSAANAVVIQNGPPPGGNNTETPNVVNKEESEEEEENSEGDEAKDKNEETPHEEEEGKEPATTILEEEEEKENVENVETSGGDQQTTSKKSKTKNVNKKQKKREKGKQLTTNEQSSSNKVVSINETFYTFLKSVFHNPIDVWILVFYTTRCIHRYRGTMNPSPSPTGKKGGNSTSATNASSAITGVGVLSHPDDTKIVTFASLYYELMISFVKFHGQDIHTSSIFVTVLLPRLMELHRALDNMKPLIVMELPLRFADLISVIQTKQASKPSVIQQKENYNMTLVSGGKIEEGVKRQGELVRWIGQSLALDEMAAGDGESALVRDCAVANYFLFCTMWLSGLHMDFFEAESVAATRVIQQARTMIQRVWAATQVRKKIGICFHRQRRLTRNAKWAKRNLLHISASILLLQRVGLAYCKRYSIFVQVKCLKYERKLRHLANVMQRVGRGAAERMEMFDLSLVRRLQRVARAYFVRKDLVDFRALFRVHKLFQGYVERKWTLFPLYHRRCWEGRALDIQRLTSAYLTRKQAGRDRSCLLLQRRSAKLIQIIGQNYVFRRNLGRSLRLLVSVFKGFISRQKIAFEVYAQKIHEEKIAFHKLLQGDGWPTYHALLQRNKELNQEIEELNFILDRELSYRKLQEFNTGVSPMGNVTGRRSLSPLAHPSDNSKDNDILSLQKPSLLASPTRLFQKVHNNVLLLSPDLAKKRNVRRMPMSSSGEYDFNKSSSLVALSADHSTLPRKHLVLSPGTDKNSGYNKRSISVPPLSQEDLALQRQPSCETPPPAGGSTSSQNNRSKVVSFSPRSTGPKKSTLTETKTTSNPFAVVDVHHDNDPNVTRSASRLALNNVLNGSTSPYKNKQAEREKQKAEQVKSMKVQLDKSFGAEPPPGTSDLFSSPGSFYKTPSSGRLQSYNSNSSFLSPGANTSSFSRSGIKIHQVNNSNQFFYAPEDGSMELGEQCHSIEEHNIKMKGVKDNLLLRAKQLLFDGTKAMALQERLAALESELEELQEENQTKEANFQQQAELLHASSEIDKDTKQFRLDHEKDMRQLRVKLAHEENESKNAEMFVKVYERKLEKLEDKLMVEKDNELDMNDSMTFMKNEVKMADRRSEALRFQLSLAEKNNKNRLYLEECAEIVKGDRGSSVGGSSGSKKGGNHTTLSSTRTHSSSPSSVNRREKTTSSAISTNRTSSETPPPQKSSAKKKSNVSSDEI